MSDANGSRRTLGDLAKRAAVVATIAVLILAVAAFFWAVSQAWLVLFVAVLFAVLLDGMTRLVVRWLRALLHVPLAGLLAIIACLLTFIPYLGTIISMVPALLLALLVSSTTVLYELLLYLFAHALEGYLVTPLVRSRTVRLIP